MADAGTTGPDDDFARESFVDIGAWSLGRNMFGPLRGPWLDDAWKGWWGEAPFEGVELVKADFRVARRVATDLATHVTFLR